MNENRNLIVAFALAFAVIVGWNYFVLMPADREHRAQVARQAQLAQLAHQEKAETVTHVQAPGGNSGPGHLARAAALKLGGARVAIDTPTVDGSLRLKGARFDDLRLKNYRETLDPRSPEIIL